MMIDNGISRFKCSTIAEAEMLAMTGAADILLAYQPVGPKAERFLQLIKKYSSVTFSCLCDDIATLERLSKMFSAENATVNIFVDLNTGMNRTGISPHSVYDLIEKAIALPAVRITGLHSYDGHIKDSNVNDRQQRSDVSYRHVEEALDYIRTKTGETVSVVSGGSPTFFTHTQRGVQCSPGTFVFWDKGYQQSFPDQPFQFAALVITRIISIGSNEQITTDLGYKSVASENPLPRVHFLNAPEAVPVMHSEEHLVCKVPDSSKYSVGDVLYGVPVHICPTVALYDEAKVVDGHDVIATWDVVARKRRINI
jgi:D-serine deaminase-like pyridoxal phosphate-dependent protein